jgi:flagellar biosynthetic protein FliR
MLEQLIGGSVFLFLLVFTRVGAALMWLPGVGTAAVPVNVRLAIALLASLALVAPLAPVLPEPPAQPSGLAILLAGEALIGTMFGLIGRVLLAALQTAGTFLALFASIANAFVNDPVAEQQSSTVSGFLSLLGATLIVATDLHEVMLRALVGTYGLFVPGEPLPVGDVADLFARQVSDSFRLGFQLASPFLISAMIYNVGLGVLGRLMPTLHVFFFGLPAQIGLQLWLLTAVISGMMLVFADHFRAAWGIFASP